jgi:hypothetical protein
VEGRASRTGSALQREVECAAVGRLPCSKHACKDGVAGRACTCAADTVLPTGECGCRGVEDGRGGRGREEGGEGHVENMVAEPRRYRCDAQASRMTQGERQCGERDVFDGRSHSCRTWRGAADGDGGEREKCERAKCGAKNGCGGNVHCAWRWR